jgi:hypothetical protein
VHVAGVDVLESRSERLATRARQGGSWCGGRIEQLEVGVKCREVQRRLRSELIDEPGTELVDLALRIVVARNEQRGDLEPDARLALDPGERVEHGCELGKAQLLVEVLTERL